MTESTKVDDRLFGYANGDVSFGENTGLANVVKFGDKLDSAHRAQNRDLSWLNGLNVHC